MLSLAMDQHDFLVDLLPLLPPISKTTLIQCDEGDSKLALRFAIAEYHIAEPKPKTGTLWINYSISHSSLQRYTIGTMMSGSQYK